MQPIGGRTLLLAASLLEKCTYRGGYMLPSGAEKIMIVNFYEILCPIVEKIFFQFHQFHYLLSFAKFLSL